MDTGGYGWLRVVTCGYRWLQEDSSGYIWLQVVWVVMGVYELLQLAKAGNWWLRVVIGGYRWLGAVKGLDSK